MKMKPIKRPPRSQGKKNGRRVKPASADALNALARQIVDAPTAATAQALKRKYIAMFHGRAP